MVLFHLIFLLCTTIRPKIRVHTDLFLLFAHDHSTKVYDSLSFILSRPFDLKIRSTLIYLFICTRPFDQIIGSSFIYYFFSARPFDQKLGSSLIHIFHLHTTIHQKYMIFFVSFIFSLCTTITPIIRVLINLVSFICTRPFDQSYRSFLLLNYSFLNCANILFAVLPLYFVRYNHIFRALYS